MGYMSSNNWMYQHAKQLKMNALFFFFGCNKLQMKILKIFF